MTKLSKVVWLSCLIAAAAQCLIGLALGFSGHSWFHSLDNLPPADQCFGPPTDVLIDSFGINDTPAAVIIFGLLSFMGLIIWRLKLIHSEFLTRLSLVFLIATFILPCGTYFVRTHHYMTPPVAIVTGLTDQQYIDYCKHQKSLSYNDCILKVGQGLIPTSQASNAAMQDKKK